MRSNYSRCFCLLAGALLMGGAPVLAQDAEDATRAVLNTPSDVGTVVDHVQRLSGQFKDAFDHAISHSMINGTRLEANAKHRADDLHDAANKLGDVFHDKRDKNNPAVRDQADRTLSAAAELNRVMLNHRFTDKLQTQWAMLRGDLNALAQVYGLSPLDNDGAPQ